MRETQCRSFQGDFKGRYCSLKPLVPEEMVSDLFRAAESSEAIWKYMPYGPFADPPVMLAWLHQMQSAPSAWLYAVKSHAVGSWVGMCGYLALVPEHKRIEIGHVWYGTTAQKTKINTEATYLLLRHAFESLGCRRVEWKCHAENVESVRTALRMGFIYEGLFRQHMIVKNVNRDTKYFAMCDHEWPQHKIDFEEYLRADGTSLSSIKSRRRELGSQ